jgi:methionyl aminopeptidase
MSLIKSPEQIQSMREGGKLLAEVLLQLHKMIKPGLDVWDLEETFIKFCKDNNAIPACKNFTSEGYMPPFPTGLCLSINNQSVHCFPKKGVKLHEGDVVTVDTVIKYKGMHVDASFAKGVGSISKSDEKLIDASRQALKKVEAMVAPDIKIGLLAHTMYRYVKSQGFDVLRDYAGHGIGTHMHEAPEVPCYGDPSEGMELRAGMVICIEALVCEGDPEVDNVTEWETEMSDGKKFLQFEHTILVTKDGYEVLTPFEV